MTGPIWTIEGKSYGEWSYLQSGITNEVDALAEAAIHSKTYRNVRGVKLGNERGWRYGRKTMWVYKDGQLQIRKKGEKWR